MTSDVLTKRLLNFRNEELHVGEMFIGYHEDAWSAVVLHVWEANKAMIETNDETEFEEMILEKAKATLLLCATPDAVLRLKWSDLPSDEQKQLAKLYFKDQAHGSFLEYLEQKLVTEKCEQLFSQITTHSKLLGNVHKNDISQACNVDVSQILLIESLSSFDTEQQFTGKVQQHLKTHAEKPILVIVQCDSGHVNANLIACARFCALDVFEKLRDELEYPVHMIFIVHLPRIAGGCFAGFQCGVWQSVHIDDLYPEDRNLPLLYEMQGRSVAQLLESAVKSSQATSETEDSESVSLARIKGLILKCVQAALSSVKDVDENREREKMRVELVMKLLFAANTDDDTFSFLYGVCCVVAKLLSEKESINQYLIEPSDWMTKEATSSDKISEAGTFRRSCLKILESKISPVLAGVIAFIDTNQNIDICCDENPTWKTQLWKKILCSPNALDFKYSELQSPTRTSELQEAMVLYTGVSEKVFESKMPFSWLFISQINDVFLATKKTSNDDTDKLYQSMLSLLKEIPLCRLLIDVDDDVFVNEGFGDYLNDFVCSMYHNGSQEEHRVVCNSLGKRAMSLYSDSTERTLLTVMVCVHLAYDDMVHGMSYFRLINSIWSDCSKQILALEVKDQNHSILKGNDIVSV
ncbi:E3 ubiquitin-protein ligase rnf213-alpha-like [Mercenaria mercenaria]|uniref:E3 ubiquitin-protein ligase rnf213-alpha-like n=1 Tax=Mercenaria mercenaria TaxID=6596 RepID=UPI00234F52FB|nr:E3 ubiquitin-protein ligase rnf213-alpha-like [Mercenaria mercenaria]